MEDSKQLKGVKVKELNDKTLPKRLTIELDYDRPKFTFTGPWTGKDIRVTRALIHREYFLLQASLRRSAQAINQEVPQEVSK